MEIDQNELLEITIDLMLTLFEENNPVYNEKMEMVGYTKDLKNTRFKDFLTFKTGISFIGHDETYYDLFLEAYQEYVLSLLAEDDLEDTLDQIDEASYFLQGYDDYTIQAISEL